MSEEKHVKQKIGVKHVPPIVFNLFSSKMLRTTPTEDDKIDNVCVCVCVCVWKKRGETTDHVSLCVCSLVTTEEHHDVNLSRYVSVT